jgi:hypothetical protein
VLTVRQGKGKKGRQTQLAECINVLLVGYLKQLRPKDYDFEGATGDNYSEIARIIDNSIFGFLLDKLKLPINREKSGVRRPLDFKILGYGFVPTFRKGDNLAEGDLTNTLKK